MTYFEMDAQRVAHAAARASQIGPTFRLGGRDMRSFSVERAQLWITATADMEGVPLSDPRVARARAWVPIISAVEP